MDQEKLKHLITENRKRTFQMFLGNVNDKLKADDDIVEQRLKMKIEHYTGVSTVQKSETEDKQLAKIEPAFDLGTTKRQKILRHIGAKMGEFEPEEKKQMDKDVAATLDLSTQKALRMIEEKEKEERVPQNLRQKGASEGSQSLIKALAQNQNQIMLRRRKVIEPQWHAPWELKTVISGHTGQVRCIAIDPKNRFFVSGSNDRTIKFWDLAEGKLMVTLTGHINTVRGLVISDRHPYLFSCGEDKQLKCWDLEVNKVVRQYHGHLSGIFALALHPTLDVLVSGGRDSTCRVWDMRTKAQVHVLAGHSHTVESILCSNDEPQIISSSHDKMIRFWDIRTGSSTNVLTQHKKGVRGMAMHPRDYTFASVDSDKIRVWKCPEGDQLRAVSHSDNIVNTLAVNDDNVLVSGSNDGMLNFYDWNSGHNFQSLAPPVQPGTLSSEACIFDIKFDRSSMRMITAECDKTIKIWKENENATPETHPINFNPNAVY